MTRRPVGTEERPDRQDLDRLELPRVEGNNDCPTKRELFA